MRKKSGWFMNASLVLSVLTNLRPARKELMRHPVIPAVKVIADGIVDVTSDLESCSAELVDLFAGFTVYWDAAALKRITDPLEQRKKLRKFHSGLH